MSVSIFSFFFFYYFLLRPYIDLAWETCLCTNDFNLLTIRIGYHQDTLLK